MKNYNIKNIDWSRSPHIKVGDRHYMNPLLAWNDIKQSKQQFNVSLFPDYWNKFDWTVEPAQSWSHLMKIRCENLRNRYDWLRLWYSGGRDSQPILESFLSNNIHLDEIVVWYNPMDHDRGPEMEHIVLPMARKIVQSNPKIRLTILDYRLQDYEEMFSSEDWLENTLGNPAGTYGFHLGQNTSSFLRRPELFPERDLGLRDINIFGLEKPRLILHDQKWYFEIVDLPHAIHWGPSDLSEMFYLSADLPELNAKQCWLIINHLEKNYSNLTTEFVEKFSQGKLGPEKYDELCHVIGRGAYTDSRIGLGENKKHGMYRWKQLIDWAEKTKWKPWQVYKSGINRLSKEFEDVWDSTNARMTGILGEKIFIKNIDTSRYHPDGENRNKIIKIS